MSELQLAGSLKEVPEIIHRLGILPRNWQQEKAGIFVDSSESETVPFRGSSFDNTSYGGVSAVSLYLARSYVYNYVSFRSALYLEDWQLVTELLKRA